MGPNSLGFCSMSMLTWSYILNFDFCVISIEVESTFSWCAASDVPQAVVSGVAKYLHLSYRDQIKTVIGSQLKSQNTGLWQGPLAPLLLQWSTSA